MLLCNHYAIQVMHIPCHHYNKTTTTYSLHESACTEGAKRRPVPVLGLQCMQTNARTDGKKWRKVTTPGFMERGIPLRTHFDI